MEQYLMTHSLLSSWLWCIKDNPYEVADDDSDDSSEKRLSAYDEFLLTLRREPTPTNEAMQKGIDFEDLVTAITEGRGDYKSKWYEAADEVAGIVKGAILQFRGSKPAEVRGVPLILYGRFDALKAGVIYDIKFSGSYEVGKYIDSTQHPMYLEIVPEATEFTYLVSNGSNVWPETYTREETPSIIPTITAFFDWLDVYGLMGLYKEKWLSQ